MKLSTWAAQTKRAIFESISTGSQPAFGEYDANLLKELLSKAEVRMGTTDFLPDAVFFEYIFAESDGNTHILKVKVEPPYRVVYMPVPGWVVEHIWQGYIEGTYCFEHEADEFLLTLNEKLQPGQNESLFGPKQATRRE